MAKKDKFAQHQNPDFNKAQGRKSGAPPKSPELGREKNVGHKNAEEHSRVQKGNRDQRARKGPS